MTVQTFPPVAAPSAAPAPEPCKSADLYGGRWGAAPATPALGATRPRLAMPPRAQAQAAP